MMTTPSTDVLAQRYEAALLNAVRERLANGLPYVYDHARILSEAEDFAARWLAARPEHAAKWGTRPQVAA